MRMRTGTIPVLFSLGLSLAGCGGEGSDPLVGDPGLEPAVNADEQTFEIAPGEPNGKGSDPITHIQYLSSDILQGRNSPSAGLNSAAAYIKDHLANHGLIGPNPGDANGPYAQSFTVVTFNPEVAHGSHMHAEAHGLSFGVELFEEGLYLDEQMSPEAYRTAVRRYHEASAAKGEAAALQANKMPSVTELQQAASFAGTAQNVLGKLPGTGVKSNEVILVMAHLDHVGVSGSTVYNGADDNASGSSVILSAIPALVAAQQAGQLNRSVLFLWTAAEEKGLVGAQYFVDHPIAGLGLSSIAGVMNMDMVARWDAQRISVIDTNTAGSANYFRNLLTTANASLSDPFDTINRDINSYIDRQDGWVFLNQGEDVLFLFEGLSNPAGGGSLIPEYHMPADDLDKIIADNGGEKPRRVRDLVIELVKLAANR